MAAIPNPPNPQPRPGGAAAASQSKVMLSFDEISKLFSLPIAEAASILGVCTSVLKRICREHGIVRWPYRKFLAGRTVDDIRREAEREKNKDLTELSTMPRQKVDASKVIPSSTTGSSTAFPHDQLPMEASKSQQGAAMPGFVLQQGNKPTQGGSAGFAQSGQTRNIQTYMDEFKYGFPANGLSSASIKWWGNRGGLVECDASKGEGQEPCEASKSSMDDELDSGAEDSADINEPSALLCSLRRKAVDDGRESLNGQDGKSRDLWKLSKRQKLVLVQVFGSSLPDKWKNIS